MVSTLLLASIGLFRFSGGGEQALVDQAAAQLKRPLVMLAVATEARQPFEFRYEDVKDLRRLLKVKTGLDITPAGGLFPLAWPAGVGRTWNQVAYQRQFEPFRPKARFKDGRITLRTEAKEAVTLEDFSKMGLSRALVWPPFYSRTRLRFNLSNATEREVLVALADATGTRLVEDKTGYRLATDPGQYRSRAVAMWRGIANEGRRLNDPERIVDADYMLTLLPLTGNWMITHGIDDPAGDYAETWMPGTPVHTAAWRRAMATFESNTAAVKEVFQHAARPEDPVYGYIRDTGEPRVGYRNVRSHELIEL